MNHELLHALHDGELDPGQAAEVRRALELDPELRAAFEAIERTDRALELLAPIEAGPAFTEQVIRRRRARAKGRIVRWLVPLAAAAGLMAALRLSAPDLPGSDRGNEDSWALEPAGGYAWETDRETFGSLSLDSLKDEILAELEVG